MTTSLQAELQDWMTLLETRMGGRSFIRQSLDEVRAVAERMDLLTIRCPVISVTGTNGKGSTTALLENIYSEAGYRVGTYTSPHLFVFNERIKLHGRPIDDSWIIRAFDAVEVARHTIELSWFETTTLAALWIFKHFPLDLLILEVGLGGRLDATNIIDADLAIITGISKDHQNILGETLDDIGQEKAGILRKNQLLVYGSEVMPKTITSEVKRLNVHLFSKEKDFDYRVKEDVFYFECGNKTLDCRMINCHPRSIAIALMATICLDQRIPTTDAERLSGISTFKLSGRFQTFTSPRHTIIDVAHNPESAVYLAKRIEALKPQGKIHAVFSALQDKNAMEMILAFKKSVDYWYPCLLSDKRALSRTSLIEVFNASEIVIKLCYNDPILAYSEASLQAKPEDLIIVFGSFALVAPVVCFLSSQASQEKS